MWYEIFNTVVSWVDSTGKHSERKIKVGIPINGRKTAVTCALKAASMLAIQNPKVEHAHKTGDVIFMEVD